jgi:8-oxo-dGTP pyrophosphatase MutT (NUDIX family)
MNDDKQFNFTCANVVFDFQGDKQLNATMKAIEIKYWDYLDNYNNAHITQYEFLEKIFEANGQNDHKDKVYHYWRKYEKYKRTIPTSGIIIRDKNEIVVVKGYRCNVYGMPKGKHEEGETSLSAALREVREETGLVFTSEQLVSLTPILLHRTYFYTTYVEKGVTLFQNYNSNEIIDIKWVSLEEIHAHPMEYSKQVSLMAEHLLLQSGF